MATMAIAALAMTVGGCGGSGGDDSTPEDRDIALRADTTMTTKPSLTKAKFLAHVNDLCRRKWRFILRAYRQTAVVTARLHPQTTELQQYTRGVRFSYFPSIDFHIFDEVQRLGAPPGENHAIEDVIGTMQVSVERGERMRMTSPAQVEALFDGYNRRASRYGLSACLVSGAHLPRHRRT